MLCEAVPMSSYSTPMASPGGTVAWAPVTQAALDARQATAFAPLFKALGDPVRLRLLSMIASAGDGEVCVCDLTGQFTLTGPTISHHLKVLREAGLITGDRRGTWIYYRVRPDALRLASEVLAPGTVHA